MDDEADRQQQQQQQCMLLATNYVAALRTAATSDCCFSPLPSLATPPTCHARRLRCMLLLNNQHVWGQAAPSCSSASAAIIFKLNFFAATANNKNKYNTNAMPRSRGKLPLRMRDCCASPAATCIKSWRPFFIIFPPLLLHVVVAAARCCCCCCFLCSHVFCVFNSFSLNCELRPKIA